MKKTALSQLIDKLDARIAANENTSRHVLLTDIRFEANLLRQEEREDIEEARFDGRMAMISPNSDLLLSGADYFNQSFEQ